ncbi:unnamed protein product [Somion occarium]|uniref:phosphatidylinositol-3,4,5-trisphosphate 3-phosphatase n=1 Tax=Somion occarium TaxID=3059160 RepID=A0ABP1DQA0_9APHY
MTDFVRRLVSGNKARFKDGDLDVDLDLAYITDRVIVMGYPATGIEGFYRNRREDAKRFLEHRHGKNYWVFNFCPVRENSYPDSVFDGRVSRYPFPDHHAPPLAILALVAREIREWLDGSPERVAVLHCKAGKGRSGTMACAYLLSLEFAPSRPQLERNKDTTERAIERAKELMNTMPTDDALPENEISRDPSEEDLVKVELSSKSPGPDGPVKTESVKSETTNSLSRVLDLHTSRRMISSSPGKNVKPGVSIPSQRRWLYYWSLLLAHQEPPGFWSLDPKIQSQPPPKVQLTQVKLRTRQLSGVKYNLVKAANALIDSTSLGRISSMRANATAQSKGQIWISLARYDDDLVGTLEKWEKRTRNEDGNMGKRRNGSENRDEHIEDLFKTDKWDKAKMVRSFARLGGVGDASVQQEDATVSTHILSPLSNDNWESIRHNIEEDEGKAAPPGGDVVSEETSLYDVTRALNGGGGIVLNANRDVRAKLYMGQVFMGWFWFIPTFHMQHPRSAGAVTTLRLSRKELDFPLGIGSNIIDLEVTMEWCSESADVVEPPVRQGSPESQAGEGEPTGFAATVQAIATGNPREAVEAKEAAEG